MKGEDKISLEEIGLYSIEQLINANNLETFYVAPYQRGYRWGETEINFLLNDIRDTPENHKYCLQPVAVVNIDKKKWELVDGQQRLTTIVLILALLKNKFNLPRDIYKLSYNTRETTAEFLEDIVQKDILGSYVGKEENIEDLWVMFAQANRGKDNIDNYHLFQAYLIIYNWFKEQNDAQDFLTKLLEKTYIIWHPISLNGQPVEDRFIDINAGKIKLTNAELIKALFILNIQRGDQPWDIKQIKINQLAEEWDHIEKQLHNDDFWYFVSHNQSEDFQTRIGLLFDLLSSDISKGQSPYHWFAEDEQRLVWESVLNLYYRLMEWYDDVKTYHKIGFLINTGKSLKQLEKETNGRSKTEITYKLEENIRTILQDKKRRDGEETYRFDLDNLSYEENSGDCQTLLLLYNIILLESTFPGQRFPFHLYQRQSWTIEHLHPQNPQKIKNRAHAVSWLEDFSKRLGEFDGEHKGKIESDIVDIKEQLKKSEKDSISQEAQESLTTFIENYEDDFELHGIGNLALLDKQTNSALGNQPFKEKRDTMLNNEKERYIPLATLNCFMKKSTPLNELLQMDYWAKNDIEAYKESIRYFLESYLPPEKS